MKNSFVDFKKLRRRLAPGIGLELLLLLLSLLACNVLPVGTSPTVSPSLVPMPGLAELRFRDAGTGQRFLELDKGNCWDD